MSRRRRRKGERRMTMPVARIPLPGQAASVPTYAHRVPSAPKLLTPQNQERFLQALRAGNYRSVAARMSGLRPNTVDEWIRRGRGQIRDRPALREYVEFARLVDEAEAQAEGLVTGNLVARSRFNHNASLAFLNTRYPQRWPKNPPEDDGPAPRPVAESGVVHTIERDVVFVPLDRFDELTHELLEQKRVRRHEQEAALPEPEPEPETRVADDSRARRAGLRVEADEAARPA